MISHICTKKRGSPDGKLGCVRAAHAIKIGGAKEGSDGRMYDMTPQAQPRPQPFRREQRRAGRTACACEGANRESTRGAQVWYWPGRAGQIDLNFALG